MKAPSFISHLIAILLLPFTVTVVIPYFIAPLGNGFIPSSIFIKIAGIIFLVPGLILFITSLYLFINIGKGTLASWNPTQKLVIAGPYRYCRNPMISGVFFVLVGESLLFHSAVIFCWALIFFVINNLYFLLFEEPGLLKRFGSEYETYKKNVPRWIPRLKPFTPK